MEQPISPVQGRNKTDNAESSGNARLFIGFIAGAVFAFLPVYYYFAGRDAGLRASVSASAGADAPTTTAVEPSTPSQPNRFASRLTYELKRLPEEPPRPPARPAPVPPVAAAPAVGQTSTSAPPTAAAPAVVAAAPAPGAVAAAPAKPAAAPPSEEPAVVVPGPRIPNARPIRIDPLESRDTTREIAREARKADAPVEAKTVIAAAAPAKAPAVAQPTQVAVAPASTGALPGTDAGQNGEAEGDLVSARFAATRDWLASAPETTHTIQIMGVSSDAQLKAHLKALGKTLEGNRIYIFRTVAQKKPWITVVYGAYADRKAALQALEKLPPTVSSTKPVLRTVNGIRAEMKQHGTS